MNKNTLIGPIGTGVIAICIAVVMPNKSWAENVQEDEFAVTVSEWEASGRLEAATVGKYILNIDRDSDSLVLVGPNGTVFTYIQTAVDGRVVEARNFYGVASLKSPDLILTRKETYLRSDEMRAQNIIIGPVDPLTGQKAMTYDANGNGIADFVMMYHDSSPVSFRAIPALGELRLIEDGMQMQNFINSRIMADQAVIEGEDEQGAGRAVPKPNVPPPARIPNESEP